MSIDRERLYDFDLRLDRIQSSHQLQLSEKDLKQPGLVDFGEGFDINQSITLLVRKCYGFGVCRYSFV